LKSPQLGGTVGIGAIVDSFLPIPMGFEVRYSPDLLNAYSRSGLDIRNTSFEFLLTISN
jgi:hypothetical protein